MVECDETTLLWGKELIQKKKQKSWSTKSVPDTVSSSHSEEFLSCDKV